MGGCRAPTRAPNLSSGRNLDGRGPRRGRPQKVPPADPEHQPNNNSVGTRQHPTNKQLAPATNNHDDPPLRPTTPKLTTGLLDSPPNALRRGAEAGCEACRRLHNGLPTDHRGHVHLRAPSFRGQDNRFRPDFPQRRVVPFNPPVPGQDETLGDLCWGHCCRVTTLPRAGATSWES